MKKRYVLKICLSAYLFFFFIGFLGYAQENSSMYLTIKNDTLITNTLKEFRIDSLFKKYKNDVSKQLILPYDLYDYMTWHYRNGSLEKAINISKECIEAINVSPSFDSLKHKKIYNNLGFFYNKKGDYYNSYRAYKTLTTIGRRDSYTAKAYRLTARKLAQLGDFYKAADYYETSIALAKELKDYKLLIINSIDAGINFKEIETANSIERGITILLDAAEIAEEVNKKATTNKDKISQYDLFNLYNNLANLYNDREDYDFKNSKLNYDKALKIGLQLQDSVLLANAYNDLGYLYEHQLQPQALKYYNTALKYKPDVKYSSIIYANKSRYFAGLKNLNKALENIQLSIHQLAPMSNLNFENLPSRLTVSNSISKYELLQNLIDKANIWIEFSDAASQSESYLLNALKTLKLADYLVDVIRTESSNQQSKLFWRKTASEIYLNAVKTCFHLNNVEDGFYFMEKNKALLLLEDVSLRQQREEAAIPDSIYERQTHLKKEILRYTSLQQTVKNKDSIKALLFETKEVYTSFMDSVKEQHKLYYQIQKPSEIVSLKEAQNGLGKSDDAYIEYILDDEEGYGILITNSDAKFFDIKESKDLFHKSEKFRNLLEEPFNTSQDKEAFAKVSLSLYNSLLPSEIAEEIGNKKLIIIPDYYLQNIPFEALHTSKEAGSYLLKKNDISYAYSISFLNKNRLYKRSNSQDFIGFAPIEFTYGLSNLPNSKQEIEMSSSLFSAIPFLYKDATKNNFTMNINDHNIVHVASHSNTTQTGDSWIVFDDTKLSLDELYLTRNTADLVVLSACKTSLGELNRGEGVMSLARGFFNTGSNSVLSTLWDVNDTSSTEIMTSFYKEIIKGKTKSEALRLAKLNYLENHELSEQSPYFWASFVLIGDHEHIPLSVNYSFYIKLLLIALLCVALIVWLRNKRKTS